MDPENETFETWNKVASLYQDKFMDLDIYNESYDIICNWIKPEGNVLDVGCGPGNMTKYLLSKRPDLNMQGIDIAQNMIALAKGNNPTASFQIMDSRQIHNLQTRFDAIISRFCLPYLSKSESLNFISDANRLLNPNGLLYISFIAGNPIQSGFQVGAGGDRVYFNYHDLDLLTKGFTESGFETPTIIHVKYETGNEVEVHTILIAHKNQNNLF